MSCVRKITNENYVKVTRLYLSSEVSGIKSLPTQACFYVRYYSKKYLKKIRKFNKEKEAIDFPLHQTKIIFGLQQASTFYKSKIYSRHTHSQRVNRLSPRYHNFKSASRLSQFEIRCRATCYIRFKLGNFADVKNQGVF